MNELWCILWTFCNGAYWLSGKFGAFHPQGCRFSTVCDELLQMCHYVFYVLSLIIGQSCCQTLTSYKEKVMIKLDSNYIAKK